MKAFLKRVLNRFDLSKIIPITVIISAIMMIFSLSAIHDPKLSVAWGQFTMWATVGVVIVILSLFDVEIEVSVEKKGKRPSHEEKMLVYIIFDQDEDCNLVFHTGDDLLDYMKERFEEGSNLFPVRMSSMTEKEIDELEEDF